VVFPAMSMTQIGRAIAGGQMPQSRGLMPKVACDLCLIDPSATLQDAFADSGRAPMSAPHCEEVGSCVESVDSV